MSGQKKYDIKMLRDISQIDVTLMQRKLASDGEIFGICAEYAEYAVVFLEKYDDGGIIKQYKDFLEDAAEIKELFGKLYDMTAIWDVDALVETFTSGNKETILEKYENVRASVETLLKRIRRCELDEQGKLLISPREKIDFEGDEELFTQPECGKSLNGNYVPIDKLEKIARLLDDLEFYDALRLLKPLGGTNFNESLNEEIKKLITAVNDGEFESAPELVQSVKKLAEEHNQNVSDGVEEELPRLLIVDDSPVILISVKEILAGICHVCAVTNHISALRLLENCHADIILLDIMLPDVDGFDILRLIRLMNKYKDTPVMFITGDVDKQTIIRAIDAGIREYLRKPFAADELITRVQRLLKS